MSFVSGHFDADWYQNLQKVSCETASGEECAVPEEMDPHLYHELQAMQEETLASGVEIPTFFETEDLPELEERLPLMTASHFIEETLRIPDEHGDFNPFSFKGRAHLPPIYNTSKRDILLCCARQVEKCVSEDATVLTCRGWLQVKALRVGDRILSKDTRTGKLVWAPITWLSAPLRKPAVRLTLEGGTTLVCGEEHPIRTYQGWTRASFLEGGDLVEVGSEPPPLPEQDTPDAQLRAAALEVIRLCGRSCQTPTTDSWSFTIKRPRWAWPVIESALRSMGAEFRTTIRGPRGGLEVHFQGALSHWMLEQRVRRSTTPFQSPNRCFLAGSPSAESCVGLLWLTQGHLGTGSRSTFPSMLFTDHALALEIRALHLLAGVETGLRQIVANGKPAWILRPQGRGMRRLWSLLPSEYRSRLKTPNSRGEKEGLPPPFRQSLKLAWDTREPSPHDNRSLWTQKYDGDFPSRNDRRYLRDRAREALEFLEATPGVDRQQIEALRVEVEAPTRWAKVVAVEEVGEAVMRDLTVEGTGTFLVEGIVTHNSTYLGNRILVYSVAYPGYKTLYVSPSSIQTKTFSKDRLANPIETSPFFRAFAKAGGVQNVLEMEFGNQSKITLRSAFLSADRCRGIAAYKLCIDEFQDLLPEHIPVIEPCTSHAPEHLKVRLYTGTPKSFDNNMEFYRNGFVGGKPKSTVGEWMVPCDHCGSAKAGFRHWQCLGERNIKKEGLSCERCGGLLEAQHPDARWVHQQADGEFESYRIPQLMIPWRSWGAIWSDYRSFPKAKFYNEVLGLSMDDHSRPLSMMEMRACCDPRLPMSKSGAFLPGKWHEPVFAGIDWGSGTTSYTVLTLATYVGGIFTVFFMQRFTGHLLDVQEQIIHILKEMRRYGVAIVGTDFGYGSVYNDTLIRKLGRDRVAVYQHLGRVTHKVVLDPKVMRFKVYRSLVMADFINMIKRKNIRFPRWEDMREPFAQDFCNITAHLSELQQQVIYSHRGDRPDDSFHSVLYALLASTIRIPRPDIFKPLHDSYRQGPVIMRHDVINQG